MSAPPRFRILMTTDAVGGVWSYSQELARALCDNGDRVLLVIMGPPPPAEQIESLRSIRGLEVVITDLQLEWLDPAAGDEPRARDVLLRIADRFQPDCIHLNGFRESNFDWPAPVVAVAHSCVMSWWQACRGSAPGDRPWRTYADRVACGLAKADAWVSPTAAFRNEISAIYRPRRPGRVIHNGLTVASARVAPKRSIILAAGRLWDEAKNLRAVTSIAPGLPWQVQVAGSLQAPNGASTPQVREVCYLGELPNHDLIKWMRQASIFVAPSLYEPFGLTVLEAAACGCALVLADLPGFRELWDQAALFADPRDHQALRAAVQALCDDESLRRRLQASARARAKRYSRGAMRDAYRRLYGELTMGCRAPAAATEPRLMEARA